MDSELTELDDWVGTLEELQIGLERKCPIVSTNYHRSSSASSSTSTTSSSSFTANRSSASYSGPHVVPRPTISPWRPADASVTSASASPPPILPPRRDANLLSPPPPPSAPEKSISSPVDELEEAEAGIQSGGSANTLTQSIRASFNPLSCKEPETEEPLEKVTTLEDHFVTMREATAENDLNCLLRQLEEVENTMKQLEQDDGGFTKRYSLASSSTTDPNTGCNPSPAPDAPEQVGLPSTNGNGNSNGYVAENRSGDMYNGKQGVVTLRPALPPRALPVRPPSPPNGDYDLADEAMANAGLTTRNDNQTRFDGVAQADRFTQNGGGAVDRHQSMEIACGGGGGANRLSSFDSPASGRSSVSTSGAAATAVVLRSQASQNPLPNSPAPASGASSVSEKSMSEFGDLSKKINQVVDLADRLQLNKLVVRIFRPDKTTKAILIDQHMTAGEVASMLIEKNFLEPSVKLCLVEKVPSLKVERVFEESDIVAECILSWPTKSQNMIFFESRDDHFGFIHSPKDWLGEAFANAHGFQSGDSVQKLVENFSSAGLTEYRDFLYIRKPGEKTWTRRMCVLRNSGLYASEKNKKTSPSDLVRLLVLDDKFHVYTTTGGWSKMRAPTPHGFTVKTYSAQDFSSTHVFCFCASDEIALKQWACRLRLAKLGISLLRDYQMARERVSKCLNGGSTPSSIAQIKALTRQSSIDCPRPFACQMSPQPPLPRRQTSAGNLNAIKPGLPLPPSALLPGQRMASLTPQPIRGGGGGNMFEAQLPSYVTVSAIVNDANSSANEGYMRHHSVAGTPSQHFYIR